MQILSPPYFSQETKDTKDKFTQSASRASNMSMVHIFMLQSQIYMYVPLQRFSQTSLSDKNTSSTTGLYWWHLQIFPSVMGEKKRRTRAIYKVINNLFLLYINLYEDNITYVCDSNFLYRILLIFNMALKGTVT